MLGVVQSALLTKIEQKKANGYPRSIKPFAGMEKARQGAINLPAVYVSVVDARIVSHSVTGSTQDADVFAQIICVEKNEASLSANVNKGVALVDWVLEELQGESITIDGQKVYLGKKFEISVDDGGKFFVAIITLTLKVNR